MVDGLEFTPERFRIELYENKIKLSVKSFYFDNAIIIIDCNVFYITSDIRSPRVSQEWSDNRLQ